jgi:acetyl-CoA synthetase (ADP-forming)
MTRTLSEHRSLQFLAEFGVPHAPLELVSTPEDARQAAARLGFPVAVKLCGDSITHKTERGFVRLGVGSPDDVFDAARELLASMIPGEVIDGVLVCKMIGGIRELIVGLHVDPQFGSCVMVGVGGVLAEALADVEFALVPVTPGDAVEMIDALGAQRLFGELRGEPPVDRQALVDVIVALSTVAEREPDVVSIDVNPLKIADGKPVAVDALVELRAPEVDAT